MTRLSLFTNALISMILKAKAASLGTTPRSMSSGQSSMSLIKQVPRTRNIPASSPRRLRILRNTKGDYETQFVPVFVTMDVCFISINQSRIRSFRSCSKASQGTKNEKCIFRGMYIQNIPLKGGAHD